LSWFFSTEATLRVLASQSLGLVLKKLNLTQQKKNTGTKWKKSHEIKCKSEKAKPKPTVNFKNCSCATVVHNTDRTVMISFPLIF